MLGFLGAMLAAGVSYHSGLGKSTTATTVVDTMAGSVSSSTYLSPFLRADGGMEDDAGNRVCVRNGRFVVRFKDGKEVVVEELRERVEMLERLFEGIFVVGGEDVGAD